MCLKPDQPGLQEQDTISKTKTKENKQKNHYPNPNADRKEVSSLFTLFSAFPLSSNGL